MGLLDSSLQEIGGLEEQGAECARTQASDQVEGYMVKPLVSWSLGFGGCERNRRKGSPPDDLRF